VAALVEQIEVFVAAAAEVVGVAVAEVVGVAAVEVAAAGVEAD